MLPYDVAAEEVECAPSFSLVPMIAVTAADHPLVIQIPVILMDGQGSHNSTFSTCAGVRC